MRDTNPPCSAASCNSPSDIDIALKSDKGEFAGPVCAKHLQSLCDLFPVTDLMRAAMDEACYVQRPDLTVIDGGANG